jgi:HD-like signal output (HDOD) protein
MVLEGVVNGQEQGKTFSRELITEIMLAMHTESGYELMQRWNLPEMYCVIVRDHHAEQKDTSNLLLSIVRLVNNTCRKIGLSNNPDPSLMLAATFEAQSMGIKEIMFAELEIMIEDAMDTVTPAAADIS